MKTAGALYVLNWKMKQIFWYAMILQAEVYICYIQRSFHKLFLAVIFRNRLTRTGK